MMADKAILSKHFKNFHDKLAKMRKNSMLLDFRIVIDNTELMAHKMVLAASSEYFSSLFAINSKEAVDNRVYLKDISLETMESILDYCYSCQLVITDENVEKILVAASKLLIEPIQDLCVAYISERIDATNCLGIANLSDRCNLPKLYEKAFDYCVEQFEAVVKEREFLDLDDHMLSKLLSTNELNIAESELFQALIDWTKSDKELRADLFDALSEHIRFVQIEPAKLVEFSLNELVLKSNACKTLIDRAKNYLILKDNPSLRYEITDMVTRPRDNLKSRQRIYAIGGWADLYKAISKVEVYDPKFNKWIETKPMSERRCGLGCVDFGDSIYAVGGHDGQNYLSSVERFDPVLEKWFTDVPPMASARTSVGVVVLNRCMYAIGGQTTTGATDTVEKFDFETRTWTRCAPLNQKRLGAGVAVLNGYIYVVGGAEINGSVVFDSVEKYCPKKDLWTYVAPIRTARKHLGCTSYNGKIYAIAGRKDGRELDTAEVYDPITDSWSDLPRMNIRRHGISVVELAGFIYAIGGQCDDAHLKLVEAYDPNTMEWQWKKPMISDRLGGGVAVHPLRKYQ